MNEFQKVLAKAKAREASHHRRQREAVYADAAKHPERWHGVDVHRRAMADWWLDPSLCAGGFKVQSETELGALSRIKAEAHDAQPGQMNRLVALNETQIAQYRSALREVLAEEKTTPRFTPPPNPLPVHGEGERIPAIMPIVVMPSARMALEIIPKERPALWPCFRLGWMDSAPAVMPIATLPVERMAGFSQASAR